MVANILSWLASLIILVISSTGYLGIFFLMALESACIPIPSEVIMPFSGYLVSTGQFVFWQVVLWGAFGNLAGSIVAYLVGFYGGRRLIGKYGKYIFISQDELALADNWFKRYGQSAVFFSRLLPIVRTFISLPAGIARMDFKKFCLYTLAGSLLWSVALAYLGQKAGDNWEYLENYFRRFDVVLAVLLVAIFIFWLRNRLKHRNKK